MFKYININLFCMNSGFNACPIFTLNDSSMYNLYT